MTVTGGRTTARTGAASTTRAPRPEDQGVDARPTESPLLTVRDLRVVFRDRRGRENVAVDGFSADVTRGKHLAVVGESGSGKTVSMRALLHLLPGTARVTGQAVFDGEELLDRRPERMQSVRGRRIGMVFQNPAQAFNPTLTLKRQLTEHLLWHRMCGPKEAVERAVEALDRVGIPDPARRIKLYPFQLSGGMLQRAMVAQAIVAQPEILIADEPTTAVDVTLQRQVLDLLLSLGDDGLSMVVITHDLGVARYMCSDVIVMQNGSIVERGEMATFARDARTDYARR
ncbi:MAG TPA: ABC transporter ATP-binding protein, partial [Bacillota bacterium]|nr:ABC transporter ATP-binding protein [Bacillota bacterium]